MKTLVFGKFISVLSLSQYPDREFNNSQNCPLCAIREMLCTRNIQYAHSRFTHRDGTARMRPPPCQLALEIAFAYVTYVHRVQFPYVIHCFSHFPYAVLCFYLSQSSSISLSLSLWWAILCFYLQYLLFHSFLVFFIVFLFPYVSHCFSPFPYVILCFYLSIIFSFSLSLCFSLFFSFLMLFIVFLPFLMLFFV